MRRFRRLSGEPFRAESTKADGAASVGFNAARIPTHFGPIGTRAAVRRLESFAKSVGNAAIDLADEKIDQVRTQLEAATNTAAAKALATGQFDSTYLAGTGSDIWRALCEAAKHV